MSACEDCWIQANWRAMTKGGFVADHYRDLLAQNEDEHTQPKKSPMTTENTPPTTEGATS